MKFKSILKFAFIGLILTTVACGTDKPNEDVVAGFNEAQFLTDLEAIENSLNVDAPKMNDLQIRQTY